MLIDKPRILVVRLGSKLAQVDYIIYLCNMTKQEFILNLRKAVNDRLSYLQHGLSGGSDLATARHMLTQLRKEGMSCLQVGLT